MPSMRGISTSEHDDVGNLLLDPLGGDERIARRRHDLDVGASERTVTKACLTEAESSITRTRIFFAITAALRPTADPIVRWKIVGLDLNHGKRLPPRRRSRNGRG